MRHGFTLIELMIVIAIIAIIAAIAIPNLLESRITANEAQAASSLKAGVFPSQTAYQAGSYTDADGDGRGCFANHVASMSGGFNTTAVTTENGLLIGPPKALTLMDPKFANTSGSGDHQSVTFLNGITGTITATNSSNAGSYDYYIATNTSATANTTEDDCESYWGGVACPHKADGSEARRAFGINATGSVLQSKQTITNAEAATYATVGAGGLKSMFSSSPALGIPSANATNGSPFQK